jgi:hypothetical protein
LHFALVNLLVQGTVVRGFQLSYAMFIGGARNRASSVLVLTYGRNKFYLTSTWYNKT